MKRIILVLGLFLFASIGCATIRPMSDSDVFEKYESIADLDKLLSAAKASEINMLSPAGFGRADELFQEAMENARKGKDESAKVAAINGVNVLKNAESDAERARDIMWEVLEYRERARKVGAPDVFKEEFEEIEKRFREANGLVERNQESGAKDRRPNLIKSFSDIEIKTLKEGTVAIAKASFKRAESQGADKHAPKTYQRAEKELNLAISTLEEDPNQLEKANEYARTADRLSKDSQEITELAKIFDRRKYEYEDIILWYQQQLAEINIPLKTELNFSQPNRIVVGSIRDNIASLVQAQKDDLEIIDKQQKFIEELQANLEEVRKQYEARLSAQAKKQAEKERLESETRARFEYVQSLFNAEEAEVFRKGNNVLISAGGFYFPVGGTIILPQNFSMLNKIINSVRQFPNAKIEITGHTDSIGSTESNLRLSKERANNVAKFMKEVGNIESDSITAEGYGESKPIASNETTEGRARNRRIEVLIINK